MNKKLYTLPDKLIEMVNQFPDKIVMQMKKENVYIKYTYKELYEASQSIAHSLLGMGIKKGDKVAIVLENRPEWGMIYFGIMFRGAIAIPIDPQSKQEEIKFFLNDSESKIAFTSGKLLSLFTGLTDSIPSLQKIIALDIEKSSEEIISFSEKSPASNLKSTISRPEVSPQDIASILYTSGTTARPKGVMLTHENFYSNSRSIDKLKLFSDKDNVLSILPLHHSFPFMVTLVVPLFSQSKITYISSLKSEELLGCMRETGVTMLVGVPQLFHMFYKHISDGIKKIPFLIRFPLLGFIEMLWLVRKFARINLTRLALSKIHRAFGKNLRFFACGGARLNEEAARFLVKIGFTILEGYGLTETSPVATFNPLKKQKIGSVGKVIPDVNLRIVEPDEYGIGEVAIKGPNVMKGYYKEAEETRKVLKDNWFYSGDLGYLDKQEYLRLTGRKKELIVLSSGKNISPVEVESHYAKSPFIKGLCVLATGKREEEKLMAVIVPDLDYYRKVGEVNIYGMIKWDLENLSKQSPPYKRIMGFVVTNEDLPRTRLGKLKRFEIKNRYLDELMGVGLRKVDEEISVSDEDQKILSSGIAKTIIETLSKETNLGRRIRLGDHLEIDIGLDSLGRTELMVTLEKILKIDIPDSLMARIFTVKELMFEVENLISKKKPQGGGALPVKTRVSLWSDILKTDPAKEIIEKIDLSPGWRAQVFTLLVSGILYLPFKIIWQFKVFGIKNLPTDEAFILCPNHSSYLDGFFVAISLPRWLKKRTFFLGFRLYFEVPIIRDITKLIRIIPIDPGARLVDAMQACAYILRNGKTACIFPEGVRSIDGEIKEFKKGIGILAKELNVRLIPVYISGSYESWPRTNRFPRPHPVKIVFGRPQTIKELKKEGEKQGAKDGYEAIALGIRQEVMRIKRKTDAV
ncbi:MAG: AMP-binding protein [Omnitrophica bacterium]|nr:AMP-binding protein [Candidatus Omnitrophota bacterium]